MRHSLSLFLGGAALLLGATVAEAQQQLTSTRIISGAAAPVWAGAAPGDRERIFVVEQNTRLIRIWKNGAFNATPFLNATSVVTTFSGERGLLGLAFHPNYEQNGYFFINYTGTGGHTRIARVKVSSDPDVADLASLQVILTINQPFTNHNGGHIEFGPDGYLYIGTGDGGSSNDPACRAQNPLDLLGKMLRIDVDTIDTTGTYGIPSTNPFFGNTAYRQEIWQLGLRNPWRYSFDRGTGALYIGDVGQNAREEVSYAPPGVGGQNYGWKVMEGNICGGGGTTNCAPGTPPCNSPLYTNPIHVYNTGGGNCAVTGGVVYRGCAIPSLQGTYFFGDYCSGQIWSFRYDGTTVTGFQSRTAELAPGGGLGIGTISNFGYDWDGEILICDLSGGEVFKIIPRNDPPEPCPPLTANWGVISIGLGGVQKLQLDAGAANAGQIYLLAGSLSGTTPGFVIDGVQIPLNIDTYLLLTIDSPNTPPLANSLGLLDANGRATMSFGLPAGLVSPGLVGFTLHHAASVISLGLSVTEASNPVAVRLVQ